LRFALVGFALGMLLFAPAFASAAGAAAPDPSAYIDPRLEALGLGSAREVEMLSTVRLQTYIQAGLYRPPAGSPLWSLLDSQASIEPPTSPSKFAGRTAPPFEANVQVVDALTDKQNEISMDSDINGNLYAGWNDNRLSTGGNPNYRCGFSGSKDGGKTWSANELYQGPMPEGGDAVVVAHGNVFWRVCMSFNRGGGGADIMISKSTDGASTWGSWIDATAGQSQSLNDKEWMDFDGTHLYLAVYDGGPINFWKSDDDGATWKAKQNLGSGQGNCILAGNNGVVVVGWGSSSRITRSTDFGGSFGSVKSGFVSGGGGSNPRSSPLLMCAKDSARQHMYYTWASSGGGTENVYVMHSGDEGATWGSPVRVASGSNRQIMPGIDVSTDGVVHVAWTEFRSSKVYAFYSNSTDNGATWSAPIEVTNANGDVYTSFMGDYNQLDAASTNRIGYIWCDTRTSVNNAGDVYFGGYDYKKGGGGGNTSIARIEVTPPSATITADQTQKFDAKAYDASNNQVNATFTWTASGGSVDSSGLYTPQSTGSFAIAALAGGKTGTASVTVTHGAIVSAEVNPQSPTVAADATQQFVLSGKDAKGNSWALTNATWSVAGGAGAGNIDPTGVYAPDKVGTYTIEGTDPASSMKASTRVTVVPGKPVKVTVDPPTATITADQTQKFTATVLDSKGNPVPAQVIWLPGDGTVDAATGVFTPFRAGTWDIGAQAGLAYGKATITVTPGALATLKVEPDGKTITADETLTFAAKGFDKNGNEITPLSGLAWAADKGSVDSSGHYTPDKAGEVKVTASSSGVSGSAKLTVKPGAAASLRLDPAEVSMAKGENVQFKLSAVDAKGNAITVAAADATWSSSDRTVGEPDKTGWFVARDAGETVVQAELDGRHAEAKVMVRGGLFDMRGGGQLPILIGAIVGIVALAAVAAILARRKKKARQAEAAKQTYQQMSYGDPAAAYQSGGGPQQQRQWAPEGYDQTQYGQGQEGWPPPGQQ
jgi:hypothetical protein